MEIRLFDFYHFFLQFAAADQVTADGEQTANAGNTDQIAPVIIVAEDNMAGDSHGQHLQNVGRCGVDHHADELEADHDV